MSHRARAFEKLLHSGILAELIASLVARPASVNMSPRRRRTFPGRAPCVRHLRPLAVLRRQMPLLRFQFPCPHRDR